MGRKILRDPGLVRRLAAMKRPDSGLQQRHEHFVRLDTGPLTSIGNGDQPSPAYPPAGRRSRRPGPAMPVCSIGEPRQSMSPPSGEVRGLVTRCLRNTNFVPRFDWPIATTGRALIRGQERMQQSGTVPPLFRGTAGKDRTEQIPASPSRCSVAATEQHLARPCACHPKATTRDGATERVHGAGLRSAGQLPGFRWRLRRYRARAGPETRRRLDGDAGVEAAQALIG